ncbi:transposase-like zinc-binding domain-containing protein, partial [Bacteroides heparinolyticus]
MNCPKCKSELKVKNGVIKGVQRYKCKDCNC